MLSADASNRTESYANAASSAGAGGRFAVDVVLFLFTISEVYDALKALKDCQRNNKITSVAS